ncbi:IS66 family transposase, partial [Anaerobiospirillum succiniciproducens]
GPTAPTIFDPTISSLMPLFKGCNFNVAQMADLLEAHLLYCSASRYYMTSLFTEAERLISRGHLNVISIAFSRAYLEGVCREIKEQILKISNVLRMDESPVSLANVMVDGGVLCKQGYLWCMGNASLSSNHMVYFEAHPYRNIESFLSFINYNDLPDNIKYIITDAYACYDKGIQTMGGTKRKHALCHAHCRRPLHKFLKELGVLKLYNKLLEESDSPYDFFQRLQDLAMPKEGNGKGKGKGKPSANLDKHTVLLLCIYHIINQIFVNDEYVVRSCDEHDSEEFFSKLDAVRKEHSAHLVTVLNLLVEVYIAAKNNIRISKNKKCFFSNLIKNKATEFCLYWMNARHKLIEFINDPMVPLTNNDIERAFRFPAISKHSRLSLKSMDGFHSFANQMTILQNCVICGVNLRDYIYWLVDNVKTRINNLPAELIAELEKIANELWDADKQIQLKRHATPKKFVGVERGKDGAQKESVDMYDPSNPLTALYDAISYEGLTPLDFKNTLMAS